MDSGTYGTFDVIRCATLLGTFISGESRNWKDWLTGMLQQSEMPPAAKFWHQTNFVKVLQKICTKKASRLFAWLSLGVRLFERGTFLAAQQRTCPKGVQNAWTWTDMKRCQSLWVTGNSLRLFLLENMSCTPISIKTFKLCETKGCQVTIKQAKQQKITEICTLSQRSAIVQHHVPTLTTNSCLKQILEC